MDDSLEAAFACASRLIATQTTSCKRSAAILSVCNLLERGVHRIHRHIREVTAARPFKPYYNVPIEQNEDITTHISFDLPLDLIPECPPAESDCFAAVRKLELCRQLVNQLSSFIDENYPETPDAVRVHMRALYGVLYMASYFS